jgi:hypothetical protein
MPSGSRPRCSLVWAPSPSPTPPPRLNLDRVSGVVYGEVLVQHWDRVVELAGTCHGSEHRHSRGRASPGSPCVLMCVCMLEITQGLLPV